MDRTKKVDFTEGKILKKLLFFALPIAFASCLQMLFNAADVAIIGLFASPTHQAAVGATSSTVHLIVNLFVGLSVGANVSMSHAVGAKDEDRKRRVAHTAIATALVSGVLILLGGQFFARPLLTLIGTPTEIIDYSVLYLQIYFLGAPAMMFYNFGASLLRSIGETKKPVLYLSVAGVINVIINAVTVIFFNMHVIGVALGTIVSQYVSATWLLFDLSRAENGTLFSLKKIRFHGKELKKILTIGLPMGLNGVFFSFSNLFIQSAINGFGELAVSGNTVAATIHSISDTMPAAIESAVVTIVGQNMGAEKPERIPRIVGAALVVCLLYQSLYTTLMIFFGKYVCALFTADSRVIEMALRRVRIVDYSVVLMGLMYVFSGAMRGMGRSAVPMFINFLGCMLRVLYLTLVYPFLPVNAIELAYAVYPITWLLSAILQCLFYHFSVRIEKRKYAPSKQL